MGDGAKPQDLANVLHAFAACKWHPGDEALGAVAAAAAAVAHEFTAEEAADALWAIATLHPQAGDGGGIAEAINALSYRAGGAAVASSPCCFDPHATANALWAAAVLGRSSQPAMAPLWRVALAKLKVPVGNDGFSEPGLVQLFYASWCFLEEEEGEKEKEEVLVEKDRPGLGPKRELREAVRRVHEYTARASTRALLSST
jgi:hypothetical protein